MKRNTITRLCSLAAAAVLAVSCIALTGCGSSASSAASSTASTAASAAAAGDNSCGENVTWTLADGTLTISGTGRMTNFTKDAPAPWADQADQITTVEVEGTVTSVGATAFKDCTALTTVNIADGVEYIEVPLMVRVPSASAQVTPSPQLLLVAAAVEAATEEAAAEEAVVLEPPQPVRAMAAIRTAAAALHRRTLRSSFMMKFPLSYSWYITFYSVCLVLCRFVRRSRTVAKKRL